MTSRGVKRGEYAFCHSLIVAVADSFYRKVEGEAKGEGHGEGKGVFAGSAIPLRRWEDWERSRLRKLRREEKRRREFERAHPSGYNAGDTDFLGVRSDAHSQYDGSDTVSIASSDEDQWGPQIGGYNENNSQYPPPPPGLQHLAPQALASATTVGGAELEAMLDRGWDERPSANSSTDYLHPAPAARFQLSDGPAGTYTPVSRGMMPPIQSPVSPTRPTEGASSAVGSDWKTHAKRRSGGGSAGSDDYGPLGPLDPGR